MMKKNLLAKMLCMLIAITLVISGLPSEKISANPQENGDNMEEVYYGDVDDDGKIGAKDVTTLRRYLAGGWNDSINLDKADVDGDGTVGAKDVTTLRRYLAGGWGVTLPSKPAESWQLNMIQGFVTDGNRDVELVRADGTYNQDCRSISWALGDAIDPVIQIAVGYIKPSTGEIRYEGFNNAGMIAGNYISYKLKSSDEKIVMIGRVTEGKAHLIGNKIGITDVLVYGVRADGRQDVLGAVRVEVRPARKPSMLFYTVDKRALDLSDPSDGIKLTCYLTDQYGELIQGRTVRVESDYSYATLTSTGNVMSGNIYYVSSQDVQVGNSKMLRLKVSSEGFTRYVPIRLLNTGNSEQPDFDIASIEILTQRVEPGKLEELRYVFKNSGNNIISIEDFNMLPGILSVSFKNPDIDCYVTVGNKPQVYIGSPNRLYEMNMEFNYIIKDETGTYREKTIYGTGTIASFINAEYTYDNNIGADIVITGRLDDNIVNADGTKIESTPIERCSMDFPEDYAIQIAVPYYNVENSLYEGFGVDLAPHVYDSYEVRSSNEEVIQIGKIVDGKQYFTCKHDGSAILTLYGITESGIEKELAKKEVKVSRARADIPDIPDALSVKQSSLDSLEVTFDKNVSGLIPANFKVYYTIGMTRIYPSDVGRVMMNDNVATVSMLSDFIQGTEYYVEFQDKVVGSFISASVNSDSVAKIEIPEQVFEAGATTEISYKLLDQNGVDVTSKLYSVLNGSIEFECDDSDTEITYMANSRGRWINIPEPNKTVTATGYYKWYNSEGVLKTAMGTGTFTSIEQPTWEQTGIYVLPIALDSPDVITYGNTVNSNVKGKQIILNGAENGNASAIAVGVEYKKRYGYFSEQYDTRYETMRSAGTYSAYQSYKVISSNDSILMVSDTYTGDRFEITPVSTGKVTLYVCGIDGLGKRTIIGQVEVEVLPESIPAKLTPIYTSGTAMLNWAKAEDVVSFMIDVRDQYDNVLTGKDITIEQVGDSGYDYVGSNSFKSGEIVNITPHCFKKEGQADSSVAAFILSCGEIHSTFTITVGYEPETVTYKPVLSAKKINTGITNNNVSESITLSLEGYTKNGFRGMSHELMFVESVPRSGSYLGAPYNDGDIVFTVSKDGMVLRGNQIRNFDYYTNTFYGVMSSGGSEYSAPYAVKMDVGTYAIEVYRIKASNSQPDRAVVELLGASSFTVVDNQEIPTIIKRDNAEKLAALDNASIASAFEVRFMGMSVSTQNVTYDYTLNGEFDTAYVKSATVMITNPYLGNYTVTVPVDTLVKVLK